MTKVRDGLYRARLAGQLDAGMEPLLDDATWSRGKILSSSQARPSISIRTLSPARVVICVSLACDRRCWEYPRGVAASAAEL